MFSAMRRFLTHQGAVRLLMMLIVIGGAFTAAAAGPECPSGEVICRVNRTWTKRELAELVELPPVQGFVFLAEESSLTFVLHRPTRNPVPITLFWGDGEGALDRVEDTDYWTLTVAFEGVDRAIVTFGLMHDSGITYPFATYRGINAPAVPMTNTPLVGHIDSMAFKSTVLKQTRKVNIYYPPQYESAQTYPTIYMADGEILESYVGGIDYLITEGIVPPLIVVGIASAVSGSGQNLRGEEYVIGRNPALFEQHARFFTEEVREWAETHIGSSSDRDKRGIFGISNGGLFAIVMSVQHPELYGFVFPFSAGASAGYEETFAVDTSTVQLPLSVYGTAGTLEPIFLQTTTRYTQAYEEAGARVIFSGNVAGHDDTIWQIEFVKAVRWMFEQNDAD